jgi:hypothetical protein
MQSLGDFGLPLAFLVGIGLVFAVVRALYILGNLPGRIASDRGHPHAAAISVCGWLGLLIFVLWPVALAWAYVTPTDRQRRPLQEEKLDALAGDLEEVAKQIEAIKDSLSALPSSKKVA